MNAKNQPPSLPDARPRSDRFRCDGRESDFLAVITSALRSTLILALCLCGFGTWLRPAFVQKVEPGYSPFMQSYCVKCHGPEKQKGKIALHTLRGDPRLQTVVCPSAAVVPNGSPDPLTPLAELLT